MNSWGKSKLLKRILPLVILLMAIFLIYHLGSNFLHIRRLESEIERMEARIEEAERRQEELELESERLDDPDYIERIARRKLGLVRPDEELIIPYEEEEDEEEED